MALRLVRQGYRVLVCDRAPAAGAALEAVGAIGVSLSANGCPYEKNCVVEGRQADAQQGNGL